MDTEKNIGELIKRYKTVVEEIINHNHYLAISFIFHSTKIEGGTYNEIETQILIEDDITAQKDFISGLMIKDHKAALDYVIQESQKQKIPDEKTIKTIAGLVKKSTGNIYENINGVCDEKKGDYRVNLVTVGNKNIVFPNAPKVKSLMLDFITQLQIEIKNTKTIEDKLNLAFKSHYKIIEIHPFSDGNGRTARLLMNYILNYFNLPLSIVRHEKKQEYYKAIEKTFVSKKMTYFNKFMLNEYVKYLSDEIKHYEQKNE